MAQGFRKPYFSIFVGEDIEADALRDNARGQSVAHLQRTAFYRRVPEVLRKRNDCPLSTRRQRRWPTARAQAPPGIICQRGRSAHQKEQHRDEKSPTSQPPAPAELCT